MIVTAALLVTVAVNSVVARYTMMYRPVMPVGSAAAISA
jgi:hypothetical protein